MARIRYLIDQLVDDGVDRVVHAGGRPRRESFGHQAAQPAVLVAFHVQDAASDPVPQRSRGDPVGGQMNARRNDEPWITQHPPGQFVREYLGANGSQRDRRYFLGSLELRIDLLRGVGQVITQCGQSGVENT